MLFIHCSLVISNLWAWVLQGKKLYLNVLSMLAVASTVIFQLSLVLLIIVVIVIIIIFIIVIITMKFIINSFKDII